MKKEASRILLALSALLTATAATLASPQEVTCTEAPRIATVDPRLEGLAVAFDDGWCLRCHACPFGHGRGSEDGAPDSERSTTAFD